MNFEHTEDRRMLSDMLRRFVAEQSDFATRDRNAHSERGYSLELWQRYAELGAIGALFSEADGGLGGSGFDISVVFEALGRGLALEPLLDALMVGSAIAAAGTPAQREALEGLIAGSITAALAHAEPDSGYELARVETRAERGQDGWTLNGAKAVVAAGEHADLFLVSARSAGAADDEAGISLFLVSAGTPGLTVRGYGLIDGGRAAELTFDGVQLAPEALLGEAGAGYPLLERAAGRGILALCAEAVGAMDCARDATLEYLRTRRQFGAPIGSFQALQHRMADVLLEIEQARSAVINAAAALDHPDRATRERALSAAKFTIGRIGTLVAEESIQLHGGIGMTWELPLAHYAKRLVMIDHQLGDEDHHLRRYIALGQA
ncbi:acyl-CoA dehydrogenase family protein [Achromobacter anxifer]|jgi:alkylation response protein AidB-like acyl-CoA dehydrogenase|uniref:L-prolyl-[peptidyl-carrier protein] dehydrogenase n=1 Tax=Achromobacter anxifer TaxID=1287737 RepID=A0A6S7EJB6_9BURK|nr:acyl-CoA dehydrogenase family protein [Achromobacter anxifer]MDF8361710.1 acyl-CoA dehydrogenase family protein [Achromobacter anxifer]CAB3912349.1 L-prolyl-[peptidyl-carrier protein] dehydrogenase [Achromobacter anxifer]CAB5517478.1 L-prolyl-[peptidyl-carrier protein] dehydrogenase [Achromobacter anxifer]